MATSPSFNWPEPDNTDLVKNGALAIRTAVDAIDTSMTDLLGGTTGQVLSKASGTNMDFTWTTPSSGSQYVAGKNKIINGAFQIWQRGTSSGSAGYQTADRWYENASNSTTFARESTTVPTGSTYCFKMTAGATAQMWIQQPIETLNAVSLAGQNITASAYVSASTSTGMSVKVYYSTATDNPAAGTWTEITPTSGGTGTAASGSFTRISGVFAIPSTAKTVQMQVTTTSTVSSGVIVYVGNCQLEIGSTATDFQTASGSIAGELQLAQRYYFRYTTATAYGNLAPVAGIGSSTTVAKFAFAPPVPMRVNPTSLDYSTLILYDTSNTPAITSAAISSESTANLVGINFTVGSGLTQFRPYQVLSSNSTSAYLGASAEL